MRRRYEFLEAGGDRKKPELTIGDHWRHVVPRNCPLHPGLVDVCHGKGRLSAFLASCSWKSAAPRLNLAILTPPPSPKFGCGES